MIWHPLSLTVLSFDLLALVFLSRAAIVSARVLVFWDPASAENEQLRLESAAETAALSGRAAFVLALFAAAALVMAVTNGFPALVPGAMCGTGVLQAAAGRGGKAFFFTLCALASLYAWRVLERINHGRPDFPLVKPASRMLLFCLPLLVLASFAAFDFLSHVNTHSPVDCCSAVYDQVASVASGGAAVRAGGSQVIGDAGLVRLFFLLTFFMAAAGGHGFFTRADPGGSAAAAAVLCILWAPVAALALVRVFSAYIYEVLHHHCPWCLFLPEHRFAGFLLFGLLGMAAVQGPLALMIHRVCARRPDLLPEKTRRTRRALAVMAACALLFAAFAVYPALSWRMRFGVWMG